MVLLPFHNKSLVFFPLSLRYEPSDLFKRCCRVNVTICVPQRGRGLVLQLPARSGWQLLQHAAPEHHRLHVPRQQRPRLCRLQVHPGDTNTEQEICFTAEFYFELTCVCHFLCSPSWPLWPSTTVTTCCCTGSCSSWSWWGFWAR